MPRKKGKQRSPQTSIVSTMCVHSQTLEPMCPDSPVTTLPLPARSRPLVLRAASVLVLLLAVCVLPCALMAQGLPQDTVSTPKRSEAPDQGSSPSSQEPAQINGLAPGQELEEGFDNGEFPPLTAQYQQTVKVNPRSYSYTAINTWPPVDPEEKRIYLLPDPIEEYCSDYKIKRVRLRVHLMVGTDDYRFGDMVYTYTVSGTVTGYTSGPPVTQVGTPYTFTVTATHRQPEEVWRSVWIDVPTNGTYDYFEIGITGATVLTPASVSNTVGSVNPASNQLKQQISVEFSLEEEVRWRVDDGMGGLLDVVELVPLGRDAMSGEMGVLTDNPVEFAWTHTTGCASDGFPSYEIQILRLYNRSSTINGSGLNVDAGTTNEYNVIERVEWDRALSIETGNPSQALALTVAEGRGYYLWRVRPIGDYYAGGIGTDRNWGAWSSHFSDGEELQLEENGGGGITVSRLVGGVATAVTDVKELNSVFYYGGLDYDYVGSEYVEKNWIYSRTFTEGEEGTRISERMTYATELLRSRQVQAHVQSTSHTVLNETVYDLAGRRAVTTLVAPVANEIPGLPLHPIGEWAGFFYRSDFVEYGVEDFDLNGNYDAPEVMSGAVATYYSDNNGLSGFAEPDVPSAEGYPFSRVIYYPDASNRVQKLGGAGLDHKIGGPNPAGSPAPPDHTTTTLYGSASETVLVALFGDEAPDPTTVRAIYTIDPNKVTSVQYTSKEGQSLATFLVKNVSNPSLSTDLGPDEAQVGHESGEVITYTGEPTSLEDGDILYKVPVVVESAGTSIGFDYTLTPKVIDLCALGCQTCKYMVHISVYRADDPDAVVYATGVSGDAVIDLTGLDFCSTSPVSKLISNDQTKSPDYWLQNWPVQFDEVGTYYVVVRLEVENAVSPPTDERSYAEVWEVDGIQEVLESEMETDFVAHVRDLLGSGDLEGLYAMLDDPVTYGLTDVDVTVNYVNPEDVEEGILSYTVKAKAVPPSESCWEIEVPYLVCPESASYADALTNGVAGYQIGLGGPGVHDMSFEQLLYDRWGDETVVGTGQGWGTSDYTTTAGLNGYFRRDGSVLYTSESANDGSGVHSQKGVGEFDKLIQHMLDDGGRYTIDELWSAWRSVVNEFGYRATVGGSGDPSDYDTELKYDLMAEFLQRVGPTYEGTSTSPYGTMGYLEHGHRYFNHLYNVNGDCEKPIITEYGGSVSWGRDTKTGELVDSDGLSGNDNQWLMLHTCVNRGEATEAEIREHLGEVCADGYENGKFTYECAVDHARKVESECRSHCESLRDGFRRQLIRRYHESGMVIEGETHTSEGAVLNWSTNPPTIEGTATTVNAVTGLELECQVELIVARCEGDCDVTIEWWDVNDPEQGVKSIGTLAEYAKIRQVYSSHGDIALPESGVCTGTGRTLLSTTDTYFRLHKGRVLVRRMNEALQSYVSGLSGTETASENCSTIYDDIFIPLVSEASGGEVFVESHCAFCETPSGYGVGGVGDGSGSCCPGHESWGELFTFDAYTSGEFVLDVGGEAGNEKCMLKYRRVCTRNGSLYVTEQELCENACFEICSTSVCFGWREGDNLGEADVVEVTGPSCAKQLGRKLLSEIEQQVLSEVERSVREYRVAYQSACLDASELEGELEITKSTAYYHFTLYYYDRSGRLVRTVPPAGVRPLTYSSGLRDRSHHPSHEMVTSYGYNSLDQLVRKETPDGGLTRYWYDGVGRLRISRDASQAVAGTVSYIRYDRLSRPVETGESDKPLIIGAVLDDMSWPDHSVDNTRERVLTWYTQRYAPTVSDEPYFVLDRNGTYLEGEYQRFTLHRVAHTMSEIINPDGDDAVNQDAWVHTQYSYDAHGNVEWVRQEVPGLGTGYVRYEYDLVSGNVVGMAYNEGWADAFYHCYRYDGDNRLLEVKTSRDGELWDSDARYEYYPHRVLKRVAYGEDYIQGVDYAYTIHGWRKGVNHPALGHDRTLDPGDDGASGSPYPRDVFGMMLGYYEGDFLRTGSAYASDGIPQYHLSAPSGKDLYNGNISSWTSQIQKVGGLQYEELTGYQYQYDVLNRLLEGTFHVYSSGSGLYNGIADASQYKTVYTYDPNGNIQTLYRGGDQTGLNVKMDDLQYTYASGTNRLLKVRDMENAGFEVPTGRYSNDIDDPFSTAGGGGGATPVGSEPFDRYVYDANGNLIEDKSEVPAGGGTGDVIEWSTYGKVSKVTKRSGVTIEFEYDALGQRVRKIVRGIGLTAKKTYYVRESGGKVLAIYSERCDGAGEGYTGEPGLPDSDGDGWPDVADNCVGTPNPNQQDSDGDGIGDACDKCECMDTGETEFAQADSDFDGVGDMCDQIPGPNPPGSMDSDGDGIANDDPYHPDLCPCTPSEGPAWEQPDSDGDGIGDACESCGFGVAEWLVYGNGGEGRIATVKPEGVEFRSGLWGDTNLVQGVPPVVFSRVVGEKEYELKDHLGNIRVVVSDMKLNGDADNGSSGSGTPGSGRPPYKADLRVYNNYYGYGMLHPGRHYSTEGYRYGFNGQEMDNEVHEEATAGTSGTANSYDFEARIYDPRLGRWWGIDPMASSAESHSSYEGYFSDPISYIDSDGRFGTKYHAEITKQAFARVTQSTQKKAKQFLRILINSNLNTDSPIGPGILGKMFRDYHFDDRKNTMQIQQEWDRINDKLSTINLLEKGGVAELGTTLHTIQDFYAHSNYADLYLKFYASQNNGNVPSIEEVPVWSERGEDFDNYLKANNLEVFTGEVAGYDSDGSMHSAIQGNLNLLQDDEKLPPTNHNNVAVDEPDSERGQKRVGSTPLDPGSYTQYELRHNLAVRDSERVIRQELNETREQ